jgi:hypothetical protein
VAHPQPLLLPPILLPEEQAANKHTVKNSASKDLFIFMKKKIE